MEIMASTCNAENLAEIARKVYQLCDYTDFRADFLQTRICGKWLVFANQVTYNNNSFFTSSQSPMIAMCIHNTIIETCFDTSLFSSSQSLALFFVGTIGSSMLCYATPYTPEALPMKIGSFALFTSIMGVTLAPLITIAGTVERGYAGGG